MFKKIILSIFALAALLLAVAVGAYVWFVVQPMHTPTSPVTTATSTTSAKPTGATSSAAIVVPTDKLTSGQKTFAKAMGIDLSNGLVITQAEYQCAVAKLGATRMQQIVNGATPTFSEGVTLYSCR